MSGLRLVAAAAAATSGHGGTMHDLHANSETAVSVTWDDDVAQIVVSGRDARLAFEDALRTMLSMAAVDQDLPFESARSVPIRGEGVDLANLFADMVDDLAAQVDVHGSGLHELTVNGLLRRDDGGYIAWGFARGWLEAAPEGELPRLAGPPVVELGAAGEVVIRATIERR
jgi:hypothetical protein